MDARLIAIIARLSEDLSNMEKALTHTQEVLRELVKDVRKEARKNGHRITRNEATMLFLANQQPRWSGTAPWRARHNEEEQ